MIATTVSNRRVRPTAFHRLVTKVGLGVLLWARRRPARRALDREEQIRTHLVRQRMQRREQEVRRMATRLY